jgi:hypothetical protein
MGTSEGYSLGGEVSRDFLSTLPEPVRLGSRHRPIHHEVFVDTLERALRTLDVRVADMKLALSGRKGELTGTTLGGFMKVVPGETFPIEEPEDYQLVIAFLHDNAQKAPISIYSGGHVGVCLNLMVFGADEWILKGKHTKKLADALFAHMLIGVESWLQNTQKLVEWAAALKEFNISNMEARSRLFSLFEDRTLPLNLLRPVSNTYFKPEEAWTDTTPRSLWGLQNACTRVLREQPINQMLGSTRAISRHEAFKMSRGAIVVPDGVADIETPQVIEA